MKPVTPNFDRVGPAPLSGGLGMAPADVSEFATAPDQPPSQAPEFGVGACIQAIDQAYRAARCSTDPRWAQKLMDEAQLLEIRVLGT